MTQIELRVVMAVQAMAIVIGGLAAWHSATAGELVFKREPAVPVLRSGTAETPLIVMDSCAIADGEGYHLFFTSFFARKDAELSLFYEAAEAADAERYAVANLVTALAYAFSADEGLHWQVRPTSIFAPPEEGWDNYRIETANAIVHNKTLYVFYCADGDRDGVRFTTRYQIGVATLPLGGESIRTKLLERNETLVRSHTKPILPHVTDKISFRNNIQEPSVLWNGKEFELFFIGLRLALPDAPIPAPEQNITQVGLGRATLTETLEITSLADESLLNGVNIIEVRHTGKGYVMFSTKGGTGGLPHQGSRFEYYLSDDGDTWSAPEPILPGAPVKDFDDWGAMSPTVVLGDDKVVLFYTALSTGDASPERWGIPMGNDRCLFGTLGRIVSPVVHTEDAIRERPGSGS